MSGTSNLQQEDQHKSCNKVTKAVNVDTLDHFRISCYVTSTCINRSDTTSSARDSSKSVSVQHVL